MSIFTKMNDKFKDWVGASGGTSGDSYVAGIREPRPYSAYYSDGIFKGYDGSLWIYFKMPVDVKVDWTKTYRESAENQLFLSNIFNILGDALNYESKSDSSTKKDQRIRFHIPIIREISTELVGFPDATPAQEQFIDRMSSSISEHPIWHSYLGLEVPMGNINADIYKVSEKVRNYVDHIMGRTDAELNLYKEYLEVIRSVCFDNGMRPLDFSVDSSDFDRLVGWFGQTDARYGVRPELPTTPMYLPVHGKSVFAGNREIMTSSIRPLEAKSMFTKDPFDAAQVRFGEVLLRPNLDIVHINIRGEIRSTIASANLFDQKLTRSMSISESGESDIYNSTYQERIRMEEDKDQSVLASNVAASGQSLLDNVEMTVATLVSKKPNELNKALKPVRLEAVNITSRHHLALCSTVPTYPEPIYRISTTNYKRNPNVRTFFSGVLSMSGLFRSTKPAAPGGILVGLSESGYEFKEIYISPHSNEMPPVVYCTGSTGSGKTTQMLMMNAQNTYLGGQSIYLNPKPQSSLAPFFKYLEGETINMSTKYLNERPGLLDPMFYLSDREQVGRLLADMIIRASGMNSSTQEKYKAVRAMEELTANLVENALMPANETSYDIIFGNQRYGANTPMLQDKEIVKFVRTKLKSSPFWKASISRDPGAKNTFSELFNSGKPLLVEWDNSISLPDQGTNKDDWTPQQNDGVQSIVNLFMFAAEVIGKNPNGGMLTIDEAHILKNSDLIMQQAIRSGRTWRDKNTTLLLGSQHLTDMLTDKEDDMASYIRTFIIMNIDRNDTNDLDLFFKLSGLPDDQETVEYISSMKRDTKNGRYIPSAYIIDTEFGWEGSVMCGPWPEREMKRVEPKRRDATEEIKGAINQLQNTYENGNVLDRKKQIMRDEELSNSEI